MSEELEKAVRRAFAQTGCVDLYEGDMVAMLSVVTRVIFDLKRTVEVQRKAIESAKSKLEAV